MREPDGPVSYSLPRRSIHSHPKTVRFIFGIARIRQDIFKIRDSMQEMTVLKATRNMAQSFHRLAGRFIGILVLCCSTNAAINESTDKIPFEGILLKPNGEVASHAIVHLGDSQTQLRLRGDSIRKAVEAALGKH